MTRRLLTLASFVLVLVALCAAPLAAYATPKVGHVWCFGDSYTDNGASLRISTRVMNSATPPADGYLLAAPPAYPDRAVGPTARPWSRCSPTQLQRRASPTLRWVARRAPSAATTAGSTRIRTPGLLGQVGDVRGAGWASVTARSRRALYVVQVAGNDYFYYEDYALTMPGTVENVAAAGRGQRVRDRATAGAARRQALPRDRLGGRRAPALGGRRRPRPRQRRPTPDTVNAAASPGRCASWPARPMFDVDYFGLDGGRQCASAQNAATYGLTELERPVSS